MSNDFSSDISKIIGEINIFLKKIENTVVLHLSKSKDHSQDLESADASAKIKDLEKKCAHLESSMRDRDETNLKNLFYKLNNSSEKLKGIFPSDIENRIISLTRLVNQASKAYKEAQGFYDYIDIKIHNEFAYLGRAMSSIFIGLVKESFDYKDEDFHLAIEDASCSARHILNDCVDLLVAHAAQKRRGILEDYPHIPISSVDPKDAQHWSLLKKAQKMAAQTRYTRGRYRIDEYDQFINSEDYNSLIEYCFDLERIENEIKTIIFSKLEEKKSILEIEDYKHKNSMSAKKIDTKENKYNRLTLIFVAVIALFGGAGAAKLIDLFLVTPK